jgi:hypothetical protein
MCSFSCSDFDISTATVRGTFQIVGEEPSATSLEQGFIGEVVNGSVTITSAKIEFNRLCKKWTYDWVGDRFSTKEHYFVATIEYMNANNEKHIQTFTGPRFKIVSARRTDLSEMCFPLLYQGNVIYTTTFHTCDTRLLIPYFFA